MGAGCPEPETATTFRLFLDSGQMINIYDWFVAFGGDENRVALFMRSLNEMKFLGLIRSSARKPDHVMKAITVL